MVFGVICVRMNSIVGHVPCGVVLIRRAEAIVCPDDGVKRPARAGCDVLVGAIAPGVVRPRKPLASPRGCGVGECRNAIERIIE